LNRANFDNELNKILQKASALLGKHIRTHSLRASFVTDLLLNEIPIHKVKEIVGHHDIKSTATYQRSSVTQKEVRSVIAFVNAP
jgi:site-specific recombinase XerD